MKVRDWLSRISHSQLDTYHSFIERSFQEKKVEITYDQAIKIYKTLLQIIKSPHVDMEFIGSDQVEPPEPRSTESHYNTAPIQTFTVDEKERIIRTYVAERSTKKTSEKMQELWGYHVKYTQSSIKEVIRYSLFKGIKKTIMARDKYLRNKASIYFRGSNNEVKQLFESTHAEQVKFKLLNFYVANRITITGLTYIIKELNKIFRREEEQPIIIDLVEESKVNQARQPVKELKNFFRKGQEPIIIDLVEEPIIIDLVEEPKVKLAKKEIVVQKNHEDVNQARQPAIFERGGEKFNQEGVLQTEDKDRLSEKREEQTYQQLQHATNPM